MSVLCAAALQVQRNVYSCWCKPNAKNLGVDVGAAVVVCYDTTVLVFVLSGGCSDRALYRTTSVCVSCVCCSDEE